MNLEEKEKELALAKAKTAIVELEFKIMQRQDDIRRLNEHIDKQREHINQLQGE